MKLKVIFEDPTGSVVAQDTSNNLFLGVPMSNADGSETTRLFSEIDAYTVRVDGIGRQELLVDPVTG